MSKNLSRRDFLKLAGATSTGLVLSASGVNVTELTKTPTPPKPPEPKRAPKTVSTLAGIPQGMGPTKIASTKDGIYAYIVCHLSDNIFKVRLADLTIEAFADLSSYFPIQAYYKALDASEKKLFVHMNSWRKILVLDTETLNVIHTIDDIDCSGMIRSQDGRLIIWGNGGNWVRFVNTETYQETYFTDTQLGFLWKIQESKSDPSKWYVAAQAGQGGPWVFGLYDHVTKTWVHTVTVPLQGDNPNMPDFKVLPNEQKAYAGVIGGNYLDNHGYGYVYSIDLMAWQAKSIPIDGGVASLNTSADSQRVYVGAAQPAPPFDRDNIFVVDTQSDTVLTPIHLGRNRFNWGYGGTNDLQVDPADPSILYAISNDANAFARVDLNSFALTDALIFNEEDIRPLFFARRPLLSTGYILLNQTAYSFEFDLDNAAIKNLVRFPGIRLPISTYDVANDDTGKILMAQGDTFLEIDAATSSLLASHALPSGTPSVWHFVLSKDYKWIYCVTQDGSGNQSNVFLAINRANWQVQARLILDGGAFEWRPYELPDHPKLYAIGGWQYGTITIQVIGTDDYTLQKTITFHEPGMVNGISAGPYDPYADDPNSHTLFVGATDVILAIDTDSDVIKKVIHLQDIASAMGLQPSPRSFVWVNAIALVYQPQENYLYAVHLDRAFVSIYDLTNDRFLPFVIPLNGFFPAFAFANDNRTKIYVLGTRSDNVSVIDVSTKTVEKVIDLHDYLHEVYLPLILRSTR